MKTVITEEVINFHNKIKNDENHRYCSWEHCYTYFKNKPDNLDLASLHLGFYLASWGMYRGSSFLLHKDYKIHEGAVHEILKDDYDTLRGISLEDFSEKKATLLFSLINEIRAYYKEVKKSVPAAKQDRDVTDTLVTKILMGTLGCIPAYDRYFIEGVKEGMKKTNGLKYHILKEDNFKNLLGWCNNHADELNAVSKDIEYPVMKIVDMYFWRLGEIEEITRKQVEEERKRLSKQENGS